MKWLGKIAFILASFLIITSLVLWLLAKNINSTTIKEYVTAQITKITCKKSSIDGTISWQLLPRPGLKFTQLHIGDQHSGEDYSLAVDTLILNLKTTPLLRGKFLFSEVNIDGLKMHINQNSGEKTVPTVKTIIADRQKLNDKSVQFSIQSLILNHGEIYLNKNQKSIIFKNIQAGIENFNLDKQPFPLQVKARISGGKLDPVLKGDINFKGRLSLSSNWLHDFPGAFSKSALEGQLVIQNLLFKQFAVKKVSTIIRTSQENLLFNPLTLSLYNGESVGDMTYNLVDKKLSFNQTATDLDSVQLTTAIAGRPIVSGDLDYSIHGSMPLQSFSKELLSGKGSISIDNGEIYTIDLDKLIIALKDKIYNLIHGQENALKKSIGLAELNINNSLPGKTPFKLLSIQYLLNNGVITSDSLLLQTDNLQVKGTGELTLATHAINGDLQATVISDGDMSMSTAQKLLGGHFPLKITGTLEQLVVLPDINIVNRLLSYILIQDNLKKPIKNVKSKLKELLH